MPSLERVFTVSERREVVEGLPAGVVLGRYVREVGYWDGSKVLPGAGTCPVCGAKLEETWREISEDESMVEAREMECRGCGWGR